MDPSVWKDVLDFLKKHLLVIMIPMFLIVLVYGTVSFTIATSEQAENEKEKFMERATTIQNLAGDLRWRFDELYYQFMIRLDEINAKLINIARNCSRCINMYRLKRNETVKG